MFSKNFLFKSGLILGYVFLGLIVMYFVFRGMFLTWIIGKIESKFKTEYRMDLTIAESGFKGISTLSLQDIRLTQSDQFPIFTADSIRIEPSLSSLMIGDIRIKSFYLSKSLLFLSGKKDSCNYCSLLKNDKPAKVESPGKDDAIRYNYSAMLNGLLRKAFNLAPQQAIVRDLQIVYENDSMREHISIPFYEANSKHIEGIAKDENTGFQWKWLGSFSQRDETFDVTLYPLSSTRQSLPVINSFLGLDCSLDTLHLALSSLHYGNGRLDLAGHFSAENLRIFHKRISQDTVKFKHMVFDAKISVDRNSLALDSTSRLQLNSILMEPYIRVENQKSKKVDLKIRTAPTEATDFFYSLPEGMFEVVRDVEADGTLEYRLDFQFNSAEPDSVVFNSELKKSRFHLTKYGDGNLGKIRGPFRHSVYENERLFRTFEVGPENPYYTSIDSISPLFQSAVLTSEDGNFYFHGGFNEDAFRKSIAANFKAGRFQRGGSTISMQLVKNVYLTRTKTIARKAEEALIVWLIESNRIVSKSRMFEVYLNIIELGPGIYGIGEASQFYFGKLPSQLNLAESIFLASLLPHPKWYRSSFDETGQLKPHLGDYYRIVSQFMLKKNLITQEQFDELKPEIMLNGPARDKIIRIDSTLIRNLPPDEE